MSTAERKLKEKEDLTELILQGAKKLFVEKGIGQTTIRNIADSIHYSVGTVYVYFKDKNAILHALHKQGFLELSGQFRVLFSVKDPMQRLQAMGRTYIQFALSNPDMYDLMFVIEAPINFLHGESEDGWDEGEATFGVLRNTVQECMDAGYFKGHLLEPLAFMIWSCVHGMCTLEIRQRTQGVHLSCAATIVTDAYQEFLKMMERG